MDVMKDYIHRAGVTEEDARVKQIHWKSSWEKEKEKKEK